MPYISHNKVRQREDDQHEIESGSKQGYLQTPVGEDSPNIVPQVNQGNATTKPIEPINKGTRDGEYDVVNDKDKNLRDQFIKKGEIESQGR